jgi:hypothetical protein
MFENEENIAVWSSQMLYIFVLGAEKMSTFGSKMIIFPGHNANRKIQNLRTSQRYIFLILQQFTTKLCNFTHLKMFFPAMVMDFVLLV